MYCIGSDVRIAVYIFMKGEKMDLNKPDYYRKYYLEKAKEFIDRWIEIHQ